MSRADAASSLLKRYALTSGGAGLITGWLGFGLQKTILKRLHQAVRHLFGAAAPATP